MSIEICAYSNSDPSSNLLNGKGTNDEHIKNDSFLSCTDFSAFKQIRTYSREMNVRSCFQFELCFRTTEKEI